MQYHGILFEIMGFSPREIGSLLTGGSLAGFFALPWQLIFLPRFKDVRQAIALFYFLAGVCCILLPETGGFYSTLLLFFLFCLFIGSTVPTLIVLTMETISQGEGDYFTIRAGGTLGFFLGCAISWPLAKIYPLSFLFKLYAGGLFVGIPFIFLLTKENREKKRDSEVDLNPIPLPGIHRFLGAVKSYQTPWLLPLVILFASTQFLIAQYQGNYLVEVLKTDISASSLIWSLSTGLEIFWMVGFSWILTRLNLKWVFILGVGGCLVKSYFMAFSTSLEGYAVGAVFHGFYICGVITSMEIFLRENYPSEVRRWFQPVCFFLYGPFAKAISSYIGGWIWENWCLATVLRFSFWTTFFLSLPALILLWKSDLSPKGLGEKKK